jgi:flavorubredoxin
MEEKIVKWFVEGESITSISKRLRRTYGYIRYIITQHLDPEQVVAIIHWQKGIKREARIKSDRNEEKRLKMYQGYSLEVKEDPIGWNAFIEAHKHKIRRL